MRLLYLLGLFTILLSVPAVAKQPGENIALGKKYALQPVPRHLDCTDDDDIKQLTDGEVSKVTHGETAKGYLWKRRETVGWSMATYV